MAAATAEPAKRAYVTFLAGDGDDDGLKRAVGLAKRLREVGSAYPLVVACCPNVPEPHRRFLASQGSVVHEVEPAMYPPGKNQAPFAAMADDYPVNFYSTLCNSEQFVEYERMVYLEAAAIKVLDNIDELFELDKGSFYAVMDSDKVKVVVHYGAEAYTGKEVSMDMVEKKLWNIKKLWNMPPPSWLSAAKDMVFARKNLPAMATLAASSAAMGMIAAAANPAICFGFYAVFTVAVAVVTVSLRGI